MRIFFFIGGFSLGVSIFLLGLNMLGTALESFLGYRLRFILTRFTSTKGKSLVTGMVSTCLVQSSSAVASTMVVLVDSGVLTLRQAFGVILGANIGTTLTAQIIAFRLETVAFPLIFLGLLLIYLFRRRSAGTAIFSLGAIFYGLTITTATLAPLLQIPLLQRLLINLTDTPFQACLMGLLLTTLVQSSSAVTALVISLVHLNFISLSSAVGLALGSNIGTVITTLIASLGRGRASRATAYADLLFNLGGVLLILPFYPLFLRFITYISVSPPRQVAHAHTIFNIITALLALPFLDYLSSLAWWWAGIRRGNKNNKE